jgi:hypothetical protein
MKKLVLDLNELRVESFRTAEARAPRGTVHGNVETDCCTHSCEGTCGMAPDSGAIAALGTTTGLGCRSHLCCA